MKKQFTKFKIAAGNLSRSTKSDKEKDAELETIEKQVDRYRDVLERMVRKLPTVSSSTSDPLEREKRVRKNSHYKIGQALEESSSELAKELPLHGVLLSCGDLEKYIAECIVDTELETEVEVVRRLKLILDNEIQEISVHKKEVTRTLQEYASLRRSYETALRLEEPQAKIDNLKKQQEQCEVKLEKDRDAWAAQMLELIAKEDNIVNSIRDYVLNLRNYHERALHKVNSSLACIQDIIQSTEKSRFGTSLAEHLRSTQRSIAYIIELCVCCLLEHGIDEEGLLRVGCAKTKLRRMMRALEARYVRTPLPPEYQDPHVIGSILKSYLRELPEPLLTFKQHKDFIRATEQPNEAERKAAIKVCLTQLPAANYANLRYLTKFLTLLTNNVANNKMTSQNLAIVMSPNMLWPRPDKNSAADYMGQVNCSSAANIIVELLISQWEYFFEGDVEFFVTLQRGKLFAEAKPLTKSSNSSNEHLDKHNDNDSLESPRFGTLRRHPKTYAAPSPPAKGGGSDSKTPNNGKDHHNVNYNNNRMSVSLPLNGDVYQQQQQQQAQQQFTPPQQQKKQYVRAKELFPFSGSAEKPEKPPPPKVLTMQHPQAQATAESVLTVADGGGGGGGSSVMAATTTTTTTAAPATTSSSSSPSPSPTPARPVPMTRTQFFGLDILPSPVADRKSNDSVNSLTFKPDLPQKPKIPKRPVVLNLPGGGGVAGGGVGGGKSDEETTPTQQRHSMNCDRLLMVATESAAAIGNVAAPAQEANSKFIQAELVATANANELPNANTTTSTTTTSAGASNGNNGHAIATKTNSNNNNNTNTNGNGNNNQANGRPANGSRQDAATSTAPASAAATTTTATTTATSTSGTMTAATITTIATTNTPANNSLSAPTSGGGATRQTPTTPISPNSILTPKRPTVPAPPPPSSAAKKPSE